MKKYIYFAFFAYLLFGCAPATVSVSSYKAPTIDPYAAAAQAAQTAQAAQSEAEYYGSQLTATAQAPIVAITSTAAAWAMEQEYAAATQQSRMATETAAYTSTAMSWTATPNATMTAVFAMSYSEATQIANDIQIDNLQVERARTTNTMRAMSGYVVGILVLVVGLMFGITFAKKLAVMAVPQDEFGKPQAMLDVVEGVVVSANRLTNGTGSIRHADLKLLPAITAERQDATTNRDQLVDLSRAKLPKRLIEAQSLNFLPEPTAEETKAEQNFLLPSWDLINGWDGKGLPYYTANGLEVIDIDQYPHLSVIGKTGEGKSRRFIRPLVACALAAGHKVVMIGKSADYWPFEKHPNAKLLKISQVTRPEQALRYADILRAIVAEMNRRDDVLTANHHSTWTHAGHSLTYIVLDELGNALRLMDSDTSRQCRTLTEGLVSEGRKAGFNLVLANQRATGMAGILSQTGKAIFRIEPDEEKAHKSLMGASVLHEGYFLAKFGPPKIAGAFEPTDDEIAKFLASRPVKQLDDDDWIDVDPIGQSQLPARDDAGLLSAPLIVPNDEQVSDVSPVSEVERLAESIRGQWADGMSKSAVSRLLGKPYGGSSWTLRVDEVIKLLSSTTTSTPQNAA